MAQRRQRRACCDWRNGAPADLPRLTNVNKIGKVRLQQAGQDLGDLDVLVADTKRRRILLAECKDLAVARTPTELANELTNLFGGEDDPNPIVRRHQKRVEWVRDHVADVLVWLDLPAADGWDVEALVVVDEELMAPHLRKSPVSVTSFAELARAVNAPVGAT